MTIRAPGTGDARRYVGQLRVNGKPVGRNWLGHDELQQGARLDFRMSAQPNRRRGTGTADAPYSMSTDPDAAGIAH